MYDSDNDFPLAGLRFLFNYHLFSFTEHKVVNDNWELIPKGIHSLAVINQYTDIKMESA